MNMKKELSILLPVYNNVCVSLVQQLLEQTKEFKDLSFEIIVVDDGSDNAELMKRNAEIAKMEHCRYITLENNYGRAKVRNHLAMNAQYEWLMFLDSDIKLPNFFLRNYLQDTEEPVVVGGIRILGDQYLHESNLRCKYETAESSKHLIDYRLEYPYKSFATASFLIRKDIMLQYPFDERITRYGYEDVLFGKILSINKIPICHINNPIHMDQFDNNSDYLAKVEDGMHTLKKFCKELDGYSPILETVKKLSGMKLLWTVRLWHLLFGGAERRNLIGQSPNLTCFKLYKLGYYLSL